MAKDSLEQKVVCLLVKAKKRLRRTENWCKGDLHREAEESMFGKESWCMVGAVAWAGAQLGREGVPKALSTLEKAIPKKWVRDYYGEHVSYPDIADFNDADETKHSQVLRTFSRAIRSLTEGK